jgi:hypothetical protein
MIVPQQGICNVASDPVEIYEQAYHGEVADDGEGGACAGRLAQPRI